MTATTRAPVTIQAWKHAHSPSTAGMPNVAEKDPRAKELGEWLSSWRRKRGLSRPEAVNEALKHDRRASLSPDYLSKLEYGIRSLASASASNREALRLALNISADVWQLETGLLVPAFPQGSFPLNVSSVPSNVREIPEVILMSIYSLASAGFPLQEVEPLHDYDPIAIPRDQWHPALRLFLVDGESMMDGREDSIRPGDIIHVDMRDLDPKPGRVVVVQISGHGVTVKRVRQLGAALWLFSDSPDQNKYPPFQADEARILGSVYELTRKVKMRLS